MSALWFRRDLVRSYLQANPEALDEWVQFALRTQHDIEVSHETVRRDRQTWGLPSGTDQRWRRTHGLPYAVPRPRMGTVGHRVLGALIRGPRSAADLAEELDAKPASIRRAILTLPHVVGNSSEFRLRSTP